MPNVCRNQALIFKPPQGQLIKATQTFERISMDFKGPLKGKNPYMLVIIDKFSRFPFAFSCRNISTKTVMCCLDKLFCVFGFPSYVHVYLLDANPSYAHVRLSNGNETTVSTSDLAPVPENAYFENENNSLISSPDATPSALLTNGETSKMPSVVVDQTDGTPLTAEADLNNLPTPSSNKTIDVDAVQPSVVIPRRSERIRRHPQRLQAEKLGEWVK